MTLTSSAFPDGGHLPVKYSQAGQELSPPLSWTRPADSSVVGYVLMISDLNAIQGGEGRLQWLVWNIPANVTSLPEGVPQGPKLANGAQQISVTGPYYRGPGAAPTDSTHHIMFELFAVDTIVNVTPAPCLPSDRCQAPSNPGPTRMSVMSAIEGHIRGKAVMFGLYRHPR